MATIRTNGINASFVENSTGFTFGGGASSSSAISLTGTDVSIVGGGGATFTFPSVGGTVALVSTSMDTRIKTLVTSATSSGSTTIVMTPVVGLTSNLIAGLTYSFKYYMGWRSSIITQGLRLGLTGPTSSVMANIKILQSVAGPTSAFHAPISAMNATATSSQTPGANTTSIAIIEGVITPSFNGAFGPSYGAEVTGATAGTVTILPGSYGIVMAI